MLTKIQYCSYSKQTHTSSYAGPLIITHLGTFADIFYKYPALRGILRTASATTRTTYTIDRKIQDLISDVKYQEIVSHVNMVINPIDNMNLAVVFKLDTRSYNSHFTSDIIIKDEMAVITHHEYIVNFGKKEEFIPCCNGIGTHILSSGHNVVAFAAHSTYKMSNGVNADIVTSGCDNSNIIYFNDVVSEYYILMRRCPYKEFVRVAKWKIIKDFKAMIRYLSGFPVCYLYLYLCVNGNMLRLEVPRELWLMCTHLSMDVRRKKTRTLLDGDIQHVLDQIRVRADMMKEIKTTFIQQIIESIKKLP